MAEPNACVGEPIVSLSLREPGLRDLSASKWACLKVWLAPFRIAIAGAVVPLTGCQAVGLNRIFTRRTKTAPGIRAAIHCLSTLAGSQRPFGLRCTLSNTRMRQ